MRDDFVADIFVPNHSKGLINDAKIIRAVIGEEFTRMVVYPYRATEANRDQNNDRLNFTPMSDVAIFIERLFEHQSLQCYSKVILVPNVEWLTNQDVIRAESMVTDFWHKSEASFSGLSEMYPKKEHFYIGFTSLKMKLAPIDYDRFAHFSGTSKFRHSQDVLDIWLTNHTVPPLTFQAYQLGITLPLWIKVKENLRIFLGVLEQEQYEDEFVQHGVHICTSQMEGFGHYINEARSIGALILTLDAPPMNELIDNESGIMIPITKSVPHLKGFRYIATPDAMRRGIMQAVEMLPYERAALGVKARDRFDNEKDLFVKRITSIVNCFP